MGILCWKQLAGPFGYLIQRGGDPIGLYRPRRGGGATSVMLKLFSAKWELEATAGHKLQLYHIFSSSNFASDTIPKTTLYRPTRDRTKNSIGRFQGALN